MISARQIKAGRALLGWSQQELADKAILSVNAVARIEAEAVDPRLTTVMAVREAMHKAGIEFLSADDKHGEGVRLRAPPSPARSRSRKRRV
jgi:predicted transcriptional regulator